MKKYLDSLIEDISRFDAEAADEYAVETHRLLTRASSAIDRLSPPRSAYRTQRDALLKHNGMLSYIIQSIQGVLLALRHDLDHGLLETTTELIHAEVFSDFLEMAAHLQSAGYKDAAAVIAGSTLEGHLRALCERHNISVTRSTKDGPVPKKSETLNSELATASAYEKADQKNVTAWLELRNQAAHGHYGKYTAEQVALMIQAVRDFLTRIRA